jgi:DNA (cytosine-5)-methyltransferase 1
VRDRLGEILVDGLTRETSRHDHGRTSNGPRVDTELADWLVDDRLDRVLHHETRGHIPDDLGRYLYAATYAEVTGTSPKLSDFPEFLQPAHQNRASGDFADRFRVQVGERPSSTVTSHISKDGHYFIHPDPRQVRSLSVREAARLQTFPDNYFFCGPRTAQYHQVGNAVPPFLALQIARVVRDLVTGE